MHRLAQALTQRGHALTCFSFSIKPDDARYEHRRLPSRASSKITRKFAPARAFAACGTREFDIAHYHGDDYLVKGSSKRVRTFYGSAQHEAMYARRVGRRLYQSLFYLFEQVSCLKRGVKAGISEATRSALPMVTEVIHCGVPLQTYFPKGTKAAEPTILFIGDFHSRKRGSFLADIFTRKIRPSYPSARLVVVGPETIDIPGVICVGQLSEHELIDWYRKSWLYCMPSSYEGFGVPAIEAMACGTPVAAARNAGIGEIITSGVDGLVADDAALAQILLQMLGNAELRMTLAAEGLKTAASRFNIALTAEKYERLYIRAAKRAKQS